MIKRKLFNLCYAPDGGGGAGGTAGGQAPAAGGEAQAGVNGAPVAEGAEQRGRRGNAFANVVYGKQPGQEAQPQGQDATAGKEGTEKGKSYTDQDVQNIVRKRVDGLNRTIESHRATLDEQKPVIDLLMRRYGVQDVKGLTEAINADEGLWRSEAEKRGKDWQDLRDTTTQSVREEQLLQEIQRLRDESNARQVIDRWGQEAAALKAVYPDFDLDTEMQNEDFQKLLGLGWTVEKAYQSIHLDELMRNSIAYTYRTAQQHTADDIRARGMRPLENGMQSGAGVITKTSVKQTTRADRDEIDRRVLRGERISF